MTTTGGSTMRLVTIQPLAGNAGSASEPRVGIVLESDRILTIGALTEIAPTSLPDELGRLGVAALLGSAPELDAIRQALSLTDGEAIEAASMDRRSIRLASPIPRPGKIVGVGYNYLEHVREQGRERAARPVLLTKLAHAAN